MARPLIFWPNPQKSAGSSAFFSRVFSPCRMFPGFSVCDRRNISFCYTTLSMRSANRILKSLGVAACVVLLAYLVYHPHPRPELTIGTVNNADMILMQRLSKEFEEDSGVKLNWVGQIGRAHV